MILMGDLGVIRCKGVNQGVDPRCQQVSTRCTCVAAGEGHGGGWSQNIGNSWGHN